MTSNKFFARFTTVLLLVALLVTALMPLSASAAATVSLNAPSTVAQDQEAYKVRHNALCDHYEGLKVRYNELQATITDKQTRRAAIEDFLTELMKQKEITTEFDPVTYHILVERMTVYAKDKVIVRFKNGIEIEV